MIKYVFILSGIILAFGTAISCKKDKVSFSSMELCIDTISFSTQIEPVIVSNCSVSGCHDAGTVQSGYNFDGYASISANANIILTVIRHEGSSPMPFGEPKLADSLIQQFKCWKDQGALNN